MFIGNIKKITLFISICRPCINIFFIFLIILSSKVSIAAPKTPLGVDKVSLLKEELIAISVLRKMSKENEFYKLVMSIDRLDFAATLPENHNTYIDLVEYSTLQNQGASHKPFKLGNKYSLKAILSAQNFINSMDTISFKYLEQVMTPGRDSNLKKITNPDKNATLFDSFLKAYLIKSNSPQEIYNQIIQLFYNESPMPFLRDPSFASVVMLHLYENLEPSKFNKIRSDLKSRLRNTRKRRPIAKRGLAQSFMDELSQYSSASVNPSCKSVIYKNNKI